LRFEKTSLATAPTAAFKRYRMQVVTFVGERAVKPNEMLLRVVALAAIGVGVALIFRNRRGGKAAPAPARPDLNRWEDEGGAPTAADDAVHATNGAAAVA
jgi:hypothetical protein